MAPESLEESPKYDVKLDIFSFGHLVIYLVNQKRPHTLDSAVTVEDVQKNQRQVGKRRKALDQMGGSRHPLYSTIVQCLSDTPDQRPTSRDLVKRMEKICKQCPITHENILQTLAELSDKVNAETQLTERLAQEEQQSKQLRLTVDALTKESAFKNDQVASLVEHKQVLPKKLGV